MPRGSKKRKAAKKKMENQPNNNSNPSSDSIHFHGDEDVEHHDEKYSDVGEVSSPGSQDHRNPSTDGEEDEIKKKKNFSNLPSDGEIEREFKIEKHEEAMRKSYNGGNFSCSGNSSDEEVRSIKNSLATEDKVYHLSEMSDEVIPIEEVKQEKNEKAIVRSFEKNATISEPKVSAMQGTDDRLTLPYNAPRGGNDNRAEQEKECAVTEPLLVPSLPCPEKKTSWKSCCGLFEVFSGSGR